jgi:16S rRNA (guanine527-N7)-methyltransferase
MSVAAGGSSRDALLKDLEWGLTLLNISINQIVKLKLIDFLQLMEKWNQVHNLTAIRDPKYMVSTHLLDSLSVIPYLPEGALLDVGTGAGMPGIPLALTQPDFQVTLIESSQKRVAFLRQVTSELQIPNVKIVCEKVELWKPMERFACIISRAFAEISKFVASSGHLLAEEGVFAAMKGRYPQAEIESLPAGYRVNKIIELMVPGLNAERHLILIGRA